MERESSIKDEQKCKRLETREKENQLRLKNKKKGSKNKNKEVVHKEIVRLGTWNVMSTYEGGALITLVNTMKKYKIDILALQETKQKESFTMKVEGYVYFNSNKNNNSYLGVGFLINREIIKTVIDFEAVSERICKIRLQGKYRKITIFNVHALTEDKEMQEKYELYEDLTSELEKTPKYDIKIIVGDMNAKIGREEMYRKITGGKSRHIDSNENGKLLIEFASEHSMKIVSTSFEHKNIYKETWMSPDGRTKNQIDHVLIETKHQKLVKNVRSYRGADANTDHFLVIAEIKQQLPKIFKVKNKRCKYNITRIHEQNIQMELKEQFNKHVERMQEEDNLEKEWLQIETLIKRVSEQIVGYEKGERKKGWFDEECKIKLEERNIYRIKALEKGTGDSRKAYLEVRRETKKILRQKKRKYMQGKLERIEDHFVNKEIRNFYQETKKTKENVRNYQTVPYIKDKEGRLIGDPQGKAQRWAQYFEELLSSNVNEIEEQAIEWGQNGEQVEVPTEEEILEEIRNLKNFKSAGENGIPAEIFKYGGEGLQKRICKLIQKIWKEEKMPEGWKNSIICPMYKKGDKQACENYRGIALLDVVYKILARIIRKKLNHYQNQIVGEYQGGFKEGRGTTEQIFILKMIMNKSYEQNLGLHLMFIDFKQAYDSIDRSKMYNALINLEIPVKIVKLIKMTLENSCSSVTTDGIISEKFSIKKGLKQGDPLSTVLFNIVLEKIIRESKIQSGGLIYHQRQQIIAYADDLVLLTRSKVEMERAFRNLEEAAKRYGLKINQDKTKYMELRQGLGREKEYVELKAEGGGKYKIEKVKEFEYLGAIMTNKNEEEVEINRRVMKGSKAVGTLSKLWKSKDLSRAAKVRIYRTVIRPTVLYGCETWVLTKKEELKLDIWERKILRKIFGGVKVSEEQWRKRTNQEVKDMYRYPIITRSIRAQRARWLGHIERMSEERHAKRALTEGMGGKRRRGRPKKKWLEAVLEDVRPVEENWKRMAHNRNRWRRVVELIEKQ